MSDVYSTIFSDDPRTGTLTYPQLEARRRIAIALATRNRPYPKTIGEGLTALGEGLGEGMYNQSLERSERAQSARDAAATQSLTPGATPPRPAPGGASLEGDPTQAYAMVSPEATAEVQQPSVLPQQPQMPVEEWKQRTARSFPAINEKDPYRYIGPANDQGDHGYGKYRVMGASIAPWTEQYLGVKLTPREFLGSEKAQEALASARGGDLMSKYGPDGAAAAWFVGENNMNGDPARPNLKLHVDEYVKRFNIPLGDRDQITASAAGGERPIQLASLGGVPTPDTAPDPTRDAVAQSVMAQQGVVPPQQQVAQAGGLPLPPPPQQQLPTVTPQTIPPAPAQPARPLDPGPEPRLRDYIEGNPQLKEQMDNAKKHSLNPSLSPHIQAQADAVYKELEKRANDAYTKQWTIWHERTKLQEADRLSADKRDIETQTARGKAYDEAEQRVLKYRFGGVEPAEGFKKLEKDQTAADLAGKIREDNRIILQAVRDGVVMGTGAGWRVQANKLAAWALQNGYASEQAANTEILRALGGSRIREALSQVNPVGVASNTDLLLARQLSGAEATMEPKSFMALLHKSSEYNAKLINKYEDNKDYYLSGTRAERQFDLVPHQTGPKAETDKMLANRDDKMLRAQYDDKYGEGSSALEIERFNRRQRRGQ